MIEKYCRFITKKIKENGKCFLCSINLLLFDNFQKRVVYTADKANVVRY